MHGGAAEGGPVLPALRAKAGSAEEGFFGSTRRREILHSKVGLEPRPIC